MAKLEYQDEVLPNLFRVGKGKNGAINVRNAGSVGVTPVDRSGTITTGGTSQTLMAANADRKGYWLQNLSAGDLWIYSLGAATQAQPSMKVPPGALYETPSGGVPAGAITVIGATTGQAFAAREW